MNIKKRVADWREARRIGRRGWKQITTWVHNEDADKLKDIFEKLAGAPVDPENCELSEPEIFKREKNAECYRRVAASWEQRQRPVATEYSGGSFTAEIDGPTYGDWLYSRPIGGRVYGSLETWIELTPDEANEVRTVCSKVISEALNEWLQDRKLLGTVRDDTGVALNVLEEPSTSGGVNAYGNMRRKDRAKFLENEHKIELKIMDAAQAHYQHPTDNEDVYYHKAGFCSPSRCYIVTEETNGKLFVALGHISFGGTSPTNVFERIASELLEERFSDRNPDEIIWLDCWKKWFSGEKIEVSRVEMELSKHRRYSDPKWSHSADAPATLRQRMESNILKDDKSAQELMNE